MYLYKRALYICQRALYIHLRKSPVFIHVHFICSSGDIISHMRLYIRKRALCIHKRAIHRTKSFLQSSGCRIRPLETSEYRHQLTHWSYTPQSTFVPRYWYKFNTRVYMGLKTYHQEAFWAVYQPYIYPQKSPTCIRVLLGGISAKEPYIYPQKSPTYICKRALHIFMCSWAEYPQKLILSICHPRKKREKKSSIYIFMYIRHVL